MNLWDRVQKVVNQGVDTSKDLLEKAKVKAKELGEKGLLKFDIMQLESQTEKSLLQLGSKVFEIFVKDNKDSVSKSDSAVSAIINQIADLEKKIEEKEEALKKKA
jgi:hypothetical protein